jgi:hypothetical protein
LNLQTTEVINNCSTKDTLTGRSQKTFYASQGFIDFKDNASFPSNTPVTMYYCQYTIHAPQDSFLFVELEPAPAGNNCSQVVNTHIADGVLSNDKGNIQVEFDVTARVYTIKCTKLIPQFFMSLKNAVFITLILRHLPADLNHDSRMKNHFRVKFYSMLLSSRNLLPVVATSESAGYVTSPGFDQGFMYVQPYLGAMKTDLTVPDNRSLVISFHTANVAGKAMYHFISFILLSVEGYASLK